MTSSAAEPLKLKLSMKLPAVVSGMGFRAPDEPYAMKWSPDSRYLAVFGFTSHRLYLFDTVLNQLIDRKIFFRGGPPELAWSADSRLLALYSINMTLFRVDDGEEIGRRDGLRFGRCSIGAPSAAFTSDGKFIWVSCGTRSGRGPYRAAEKLSVPDLETIESVDADGLDPERVDRSDSDRIVTEGGRIWMSSLLSSCPAPSIEASHDGDCYHYISGLDLETKRPLFKRFRLVRAPTATFPTDLRFVPGRPQIIAFSAWTQGLPFGPDWAFTLYDFNGEKIRQFGERDQFQTVPPSGFAMTRSGLVVATAGDSDRRLGRLMAWDAETGRLLQDETTSFAALIDVSPDDRHVAVQIGLDIRIYSISRN